MKVAELIVQLQKLDANADIYCLDDDSQMYVVECAAQQFEVFTGQKENVAWIAFDLTKPV